MKNLNINYQFYFRWFLFINLLILISFFITITYFNELLLQQTVELETQKQVIERLVEINMQLQQLLLENSEVRGGDLLPVFPEEKLNSSK